jgi:hypothetical protein
MGYQRVQVGGTDKSSPKASVQVILRIKRALFWSLLEDDALHSQSAPHMVGRFLGCPCLQMTPIELSALFWRLSPTTGLDSQSSIRAVGALVTNDAVMQSCLTIRTPRPAMPPSADPCALCYSSFLRSTKFLWWVLPPLTLRRGCCPSSFPPPSLIFLLLFCLTVTRSSHHSRDPYAISIGELTDSFSSLRAAVRCGQEHLEAPHASLPAPLHLLGWIHLVTHVIPDRP